MPSVLVELGFISNKTEGKFLNSKSGQDKMAKALKEAIIEYKKELDSNIGDSIIRDSDEKNTENRAEVESTRIIKDVTFKVQIAASSRKLDAKSYNFNGLSDLSREKQGPLYKYFYGNTFIDIVKQVPFGCM